MPSRSPVDPPGTPTHDAAVSAKISRIFREEYAAVVASLARRVGDLDIAEEAAGAALVVAMERWPGDGVPLTRAVG